MSNKIDKLLKQVNDAAGELVGMIQEVDARISALQIERQSIGNAPVSRADFLEYISQAIDAKSRLFGKGKTRQIEAIDTSFFSLERGGLENFNFLLTEQFGHADIHEGGLYWYLKPSIMARCAEIAEEMALPDNAMSPGDRQSRIAAIDAEIAVLRVQRNEMAGQLKKAGLVG